MKNIPCGLCGLLTLVFLSDINGFATGIYFIKLDGKIQKLIVE